VGTGGAIGLRAIGWYFVPGWRNICYCPRHRPDPSGVVYSDMHGDEFKPGSQEDKPCSMCAADREADYLQKAIPGLLDVMPRDNVRVWTTR
jgi:hypothetical protein